MSLHVFFRAQKVNYIQCFQGYQGNNIYYFQKYQQWFQLIIMTIHLSESYTDDLHLHDDINENIAYVMPFDVALEELQNEHFNMFLLTIEYNTVSIFFDNNGLLKLFDSHSRDLCGMPTPRGSCVLLEFEFVIKLTEYLRFLFRPGVVFELKGVKIVNFANNEQLQNKNETVACINRTTYNNHDNVLGNEKVRYTEECSIYIYSLCFATIMNCSYWSKQTQIAIIENALERYFGSLIDENQICPFPKSVIICNETIKIDYSSKYASLLHTVIYLIYLIRKYKMLLILFNFCQFQAH